MRRIIIFILLGIVSVSTISSLISRYMRTNNEKVLLDTVTGAVGAGNFSYWQLGQTGLLSVELTSLTGDADLYVSDTVRPSFEVDKNNFSSITCGVDQVSIPVDFPRPIGIGVFGHWSSSVSEYSIRVFLDTSSATKYSRQPMSQPRQQDKQDGGSASEMAAQVKADTEKSQIILRFLSVLDVIIGSMFSL